ncbi:MAG: hypothetical protein J07HX64_00281 [halophilic archaeon J07HX64]|jgi:hypothetical protein|nr:MAG: hypothetical protein J07HX64_00281 [halophilic archaeon J07HX64]
MSRAEDQIAQYLYQGESIRSTFDVGPVRIVLTSNRVFASLPDDGIQRAELPDVTDISRTTRGSRSGVVWGVSLGILGAAFLGVGLSVSVSEIFAAREFREDAATSAGAGGLTDLVNLVLWMVENLGLLLLGLGSVCLLLGVLSVMNYWFRVRERSLTIHLAGDRPDIHLPLRHISVREEFRLEKALVPEQVSDDIPADIDVDSIPVSDTRDDESAGAESPTGETTDPGNDPTVAPGDETADDTGEFEWVGTGAATDGPPQDSTTDERE